MEEKRLSIIRKVYEILENVTPYDYDCGEICGKRCCSGDSHAGMWLLPGEEELLGEEYTVFDGQDGQKYAVCGGSCERSTRPFACRIFPMFPQVSFEANGDAHVRAALDPRAKVICPIAAGELHTQPEFRRAVRRAARILLRDDVLAQWLLESQEFLDHVAQLQEQLGE